MLSVPFAFFPCGMALAGFEPLALDPLDCAALEDVAPDDFPPDCELDAETDLSGSALCV